jgi:formamidopyrimidine-DNA glycosylase
LDTSDVILAHLGMSGSFTVVKTKGFEPKTHDHVVFALEGGLTMVFNDPRRFGIIDLLPKASEKTHPLLEHLGPEPLLKAFSEAYLKNQLLKRKGPIKPAIMDQKLVVGVGNIYASESLYLCGVHPETPACLVVDKAPQLIAAIRTTLEAAIRSGGSTLRNYVGATNEAGYFQHHFHVYDHAGDACSKCGSLIQSMVQAGRATYWCASCQPLVKKRLKR